MAGEVENSMETRGPVFKGLEAAASGELAIWRSLKARRHGSLKSRTSEALDQTLTTTLPI
jgi:hypothetical protein